MGDGVDRDELRRDAGRRVLVRGQSWMGSAVTIGTVVAFTTLQVRLFRPVISRLSVEIDVQTALALFDGLRVPRSAGGDRRAPRPPRAGPRHPPRRGGVRGRHLPLLRRRRPTLDDVTLTVPAAPRPRSSARPAPARRPGYLVARLYDADAGRVTITATTSGELGFPSLADAVGVVSQEGHLVHATVPENTVRPSRGDDREIEVAAQAARIHHVIAALPEGDDTVVGERGDRSRAARTSASRSPEPSWQPADPGAGRGDQRSRHRDGARRAGGPGAPLEGPHRHRDRPSPVHRAPARRIWSTTAHG